MMLFLFSVSAMIIIPLKYILSCGLAEVVRATMERAWMREQRAALPEPQTHLYGK
jgi:hypothetical protein